MTESEFKDRLGALVLIAVCLILLALAFGCAGGADQEAETTATVTGQTEKGDVDIKSLVRSEMERLGAGAVKAGQARDIRTFGLDKGTLALLTTQLSKATGIVVLVIGLVVCITVGFGLLLFFSDAPDGSLHLKWFNVSYKALARTLALALLAIGALAALSAVFVGAI